MSQTLSRQATDQRFEARTLESIHALAVSKLPPEVVDYLEGGSGDEWTLRQNRSAFTRWAFEPRVMSGRDAPDLRTQFLGVDLSMPVLTAPFGSETLLHPDGHRAVARANAGAGIAGIVPEASAFSYAEVAQAAPTAAGFAQLHPMGREENFLRLVQSIRDAGYRGVVLTCDCSTVGWRERDMNNRFEMDTSALHGNYPVEASGEMNEAFGQLFTHDSAVWGWDKIRDLLGSSIPWIAKGILSGHDAEAAIEAGAAGLLVSNHGGRQLHEVIASLDALPEVVNAASGSVPIAVDSGFRRGSDVVKAIALGADVVVIGRLAAYGLAAGGEQGVSAVLQLLREEILTILQLLGRGGVGEVDRSALRRADA
ncbi:alpha-hydroxy acid oxidase [Georgenia yuyongxinii]|uniref:Alpha-hydroxy-acid oxidizing protein n=1 Tax=Georgenia yuyongxinii TaxID=2589797 RepID=A0A552WXQ7_9MICO|nr:alpha-hydroxy acid oxidase [Georgenia yuyongxinii]TRW47620.1 alpha-hydroxy-acid oxidizing protein [Georgenia yuyongxinii]